MTDLNEKIKLLQIELEEKDRKLKDGEKIFIASLKKLKEENSNLEEKMIWYIKENPSKAKEYAEFKKWQSEKGVNSQSSGSKNDNSKRIGSNISKVLDNDFSTNLKEILSKFLQTIVSKNISDLDNNDLQLIEKRFKEIETLIQKFEKSQTNITIIKLSNISQLLESLDMSLDKNKNFIKKFNKIIGDFNNKNNESLKFLCNQDHLKLEEAIEELEKENEILRDTYKNMIKEDKIRGKTKSKGKFKNNLKEKDCCGLKERGNREYLQSAYKKISRLTSKSPSQERNSRKNTFSPSLSQSGTFYYSKDDRKRILTSEDLRQKAENFKQKTHDLVHMKIEENNKKLTKY